MTRLRTSPWLASAAVSAVAMSTASCTVDETPAGVGGLDGVLAFEAPDDLVFTENLAVGSHFEITARPFDAEETVFGDDVDVATTNAEVGSVVFGEAADGEVTFEVTMHSPGTVRFAVTSDGDVVDRFTLTAVQPAITRLVDSVLLSSSTVDATVPAAFAVLAEADTTFLVAAIDRCGGGVLDLNASTIEAVGEEGVEAPTAVQAGVEGITLKAPDPGRFSVILKSPGLDDLAYDVEVVDPDDVDEVEAEAASVDDTAVTMWGRAYSNDTEVLGLNFSWEATERVTLDVSEGPVAIASIFFPTDGTADDRPAVITVETLGEENDLDLLALQTTSLNAVRDAPPTRDGEDDATDTADTSLSCASCGESSEGCDPLAASLPGLFVWRLRRRNKKRNQQQ